MNGMKNVIIQLTYSLNGPMINLLFYCHIVLYCAKVTSYDKFRQSFTLSAMLLMKVSKLWKIDEFPKISININQKS